MKRREMALAAGFAASLAACDMNYSGIDSDYRNVAIESSSHAESSAANADDPRARASGEAAKTAAASHRIRLDDARLIADDGPLRPANFFVLAWRDDGAADACADAADSLSKPYATPSNLFAGEAKRGQPAGRPDAAARAAHLLGTSDNVRWSVRKHNLGPGLVAESAFVDIFNDGVSRLVIRQQGSLASEQRLAFSVTSDAEAPAIEALSLAGLQPPPALKSKLTTDALSAAFVDLLRIDDRYLTLFTLSGEFAGDSQVFVADWRPAADVAEWRKPGDYQPSLLCAFAPSSEGRRL